MTEPTVLQNKAKNFLIALAEGEKDLEASRSGLCRCYNFVPADVFSRVNRDNSHGIEVQEIINFLKDNSVTDCDESEVRHLVDYYDTLEKDRNQILTNDEWNSILLPCEDNSLREQVLAREAAEWKDIGRLPADIEGQVADIIIKEIGLMRKLEALKSVLFTIEEEQGKGFSMEGLFKQIDDNKNGEFTMEELSAFLKKAGYDASEHECVQIIRRMDTDGSLTISLVEFDKFLKPLNPAPKEVDVANYNPSSYVPERPYWSYGYRYPSYSRLWDAPYYSRYGSVWDSYYPYYRSYSSPYYRSSPYYYDRYRSYYGGFAYSSHDAYLDAKYGTYYAPVRTVYEPTVYTSPVRTVYESPVRKEVVYSSYSPVSTAYSYSSPVRTVYSSSPYRSYYDSPYRSYYY
jgi:Ca2+-binding EF-hand superfamily protein